MLLLIKYKNIDELLTKEGQIKLKNSSMEEIQSLFEKSGYKTTLSESKGTGGGQRLIIERYKIKNGESIGSIRSNTSEGSHRSTYRIISGNFKNEKGENITGKIKIVDGDPNSYHIRGNTPEKAEIIFIKAKAEDKK